MDKNCKAFHFSWIHPNMGTDDENGITKLLPRQKIVVIANNKQGAEEQLRRRDEKLKAVMRNELAGRPTHEVEKLISKATKKAGLSIQVFDLDDLDAFPEDGTEVLFNLKLN